MVWHRISKSGGVIGDAAAQPAEWVKIMIKHKKWLGLCTLAGATLCIGVLTHHEVPEPELPISDTAQQAEFEDQVAEFLDNNPQPDSSDLDYTVKGKNAY